MSNIVQYHNDLNSLQMSGFTEKEIDMFFALCFKLKNKDTSEVILTFDELRDLTNYKYRGVDRFYKIIDNTYKNLLNLNFRIETEDEIIRFTLFNEFRINKTNQNLIVRVNDRFKYILNDFMSHYTKFDLEEMVSLKSVYSKGFYKILKQFRITGWYEISLKEFRLILDVPENYNLSDLNKRVLKPILEELNIFFLNLKLEKIKKGRNIDKLKFTWDIEKVKVIENVEVDNQVQIEINTIKTIIPILCDKDIENLLKFADMTVILEKYYTLALNKNFDNLTGFLLSAIKNDWKTVSQADKEFKKETGEMDELEAKIQKRLFEKLNKREG